MDYSTLLNQILITLKENNTTPWVELLVGFALNIIASFIFYWLVSRRFELQKAEDDKNREKSIQHRNRLFALAESMESLSNDLSSMRQQGAFLDSNVDEVSARVRHIWRLGQDQIQEQAYQEQVLGQWSRLEGLRVALEGSVSYNQFGQYSLWCNDMLRLLRQRILQVREQAIRSH